MFYNWFLRILFLLSIVCGSKENSCHHHNNDESENVEIEDLIKTSPVILKALGARIFADNIFDNKLVTNKDNVVGNHDNDVNDENNNNKENDEISVEDTTTIIPQKPTLITLTPQTVYKGASILKSTSSRNIENNNNGAGGEYYKYDGQLNATIKSIDCLDMKILELLPMQLIVFGTLDSGNSGIGNFGYGNFGGQIGEIVDHDVIKIVPGGLFKWSTELEANIWKYLGWDNWSDFTPCSIACGKGVQQRFRRCLLDNLNNNQGYYSDGNGDLHFETEVNDNDDSMAADTDNNYSTNNNDSSNNITPKSFISYHNSNAQLSKKHRSHHKKDISFKKAKKRRKKKVLKGEKSIFKGQKLSTLSCEGYNIEQRNCNMFDCTDDIIDLLKFYKKPFLSNDTTGNVNLSSYSVTTSSESTNLDGDLLTSTILPSVSSAASTSSSINNVGGGGGIGGYIPSWENSLNFTIMMTLKAKIPSQSTIFSLRNISSNLYVDQNHHGLKLYQERDDLSEMLPIKLNLFDSRWHQIAISVRNGDFISVYIDCIWMNSFVVSKHLLTLPNGADVEVGRGFNGEIQQLIIMSGIYDKQQCSRNRTPINEVKRYIINTFIDDGEDEDDDE